jgi:Ca2+-transporting ATPase
VLSIGLGAWKEPDHGWIEGLAILLAVVIVVLVNSVNNYNQERAFRAQDATKKKPQCSVMRSGKVETINQEQLLVGDLVLLSAGAAIPADGIMVSVEGIKVNESQMTGENIDVVKKFEEPFLRAGTDIREGECMMLVTATGSNSVYGKILASLAEEPKPTPLQIKLENTAGLVGYIGGGVAILLFLALVIRFIVEKANGTQVRDADGELQDREYTELLDFFIIAVTIVVVAIPEGLPLAVTVSLAYSMKKMGQDNLLVKVLSACETMGNATAVCSDKTGTLTTNRMTVVSSYLGGRLFPAGSLPTREQLGHQFFDYLVGALVINSKAYCSTPDDRKDPLDWAWSEGNQTEVGLLCWMIGYKVDIPSERKVTNH